MAAQFQSLSNLLRDFSIGLFTNILAAILLGIRNKWLGFIFFWIFLFIIIGYLSLKKYGRLLKVLWSGAHGYYYSFPVEENRTVWGKISDSFRYLGISSDSILHRFRDWVESLPKNSSLRFYFLLMDPEAKALRHQIAHYKATDPNNPKIIQEIETIRKRIISSIETLKNLEIYKEGKLKMRVYDEFIPWWMYVMDGQEIFLGILPKGKSGLDSPVLVIKENKKHTTLFNAFMSTWDRIWENGKEV
jgi:gamma-glutamylcyclotransferase (GGCT)/AIG2-like uncharacterized protein YtfP